MADSQRKFEAAVHVIRSLPKSGAFQPSNEMMLKFYGYYKQAKEGPCYEAKPSFWDMVKKAKWEAWSKLGDTSKEEAMENYVSELKEVIRNMPETDQTSQFVKALEPFYKVAYKKEETAPPIFNIFRKKHHSTPGIKMNGHATPYIQENGNSDEPRLDTSQASSIHNITGTAIKENGQSNGDIQTTSSLDINEENGIKPDLSNHVTNDAVSHHVENEHSDVIVLSDSNNDSNGKDCDDDDDDEDDDELFCDSLGPELLEEQIGREQMLHSGMLESVPEDVVPLNDRNLSSFSDVEILEQFDSKKNGGSDGETSCPHSDKIVHVHFEDLNTSPGENTSINQELPKEHGVKECVVQPNKMGASGSSDNRGLSRAAGSDGKQAHRNVQHSDRSSRYTERYRRRSQESDSDESPGRSDHNSSSERDDAAIDKIADLLVEIQDNMKKILERLKRLETSLQQSQSTWFENYRPSKTFIFLILWPIIVNFLFKFLRRRFFKKR